jgi:hypothetical protein
LAQRPSLDNADLHAVSVMSVRSGGEYPVTAAADALRGDPINGDGHRKGARYQDRVARPDGKRPTSIRIK